MQNRWFLKVISLGLITLLVGSLVGACQPPETQAGDFLLVTLDELRIDDTTDGKNAGEVAFRTQAVGLNTEGKILPDEPIQVNGYPYPNTFWVEVDPGKSIKPPLPLYFSPWDKTPPDIFVSIQAWDDDKSPFGATITSIGKFFEVVGNLKDIANDLREPPQLQAPDGIGFFSQEWVQARLIQTIWRKMLEKANLYNKLVDANLYGQLSSIAGGLLQSWGEYIQSDEEVLFSSWRASTLDASVKPQLNNQWGMKEKDSVTYPIKCTSKKCEGQSVGQVTFRRIHAPQYPLEVEVEIRSITLGDDREPSSSPEIFLQTRFVDGLSPIAEISGAPLRIQDQFNQKDNYFLGYTRRLPARGESEAAYYNLPTGKPIPMDRFISSFDHVVGPFFYTEISIYEDDRGSLVPEDDLDWLGTYSNLMITNKMIDKYDQKLREKGQAEYCETLPVSSNTLSKGYGTELEVCYILKRASVKKTTTPIATPRPTLVPPNPGTCYIGYNTSRAPFSSQKFRKAFSAAIDRQALLQAAGGVERAPATTFGPPGLWDDQRYLFEKIGVKFDPSRARNWLAEAQFEANQDGDTPMPGRLVLGSPNSEAALKVTEYIKNAWKTHLNVDVTIVPMEWQAYLQWLNETPPEAYYLCWVADYADLYNFYQVFNEQNPNNYARYASPFYNQLLQQMLTEKNKADRSEIFMEAEKILCEEDIAIAPLFHYLKNP